MKKIFLVSIAVLLLAIVACTPTSMNPDQVIDVSPGKSFKIIIDANPTTGYHWEIVGELDPNIVEFVSKDYQSTGQPGLVGAGGVETWTFKAVAAGQVKITLGYYPPSNTATEPANTKVFTIKVK